MKNKFSIRNRVLSALLALTMILMYVPVLMFPAGAGATEKAADPSTLHAWKDYFGSGVLNTASAGGVWMDKSVFTDNTAFNRFLDGDGKELVKLDHVNNFLVALSAISSNKEITGYSHIPTDTMLVLDVSGSMGNVNAGGNDAVDELIASANSAITELQKANKYSRVGVVLYSGANTTSSTSGAGTTTVLLPLERYSHSTGAYLVKGSSWSGNTVYETIAVNSNVSDSSGRVGTSSKTVRGGTYIQNGIFQAMQQLLAVEDTSIQGDSFQSGTTRIPIMVLMSDGAPTVGTSNYAGVTDNRGNTTIGNANIGNGSATSETLGFVTQLTASYAKARIEEHYGRSPLFFTLGFGVGDDEVAKSVLDPKNSTNTINSFWNAYNSFTPSYFNTSLNINDGTHSTTVTKNSYVSEQVYTDSYFHAQTQQELMDAFKEIVGQIILQSLYFPTLVEQGTGNLEGYIEFIDDIGDYMEIKEIEGVELGDILFTGALLSENFRPDGGQLGTVEKPNAMGDAMVDAVITRMGIDKKYGTRTEQLQAARDLITMAYQHGQLSYTSETEFSNYIGWYADENGNYAGFRHESHTENDRPADAVYICRSYGMLGQVKDGFRESDLMYMSIQVRTNVSDGHSTLIWKIPAALIPVVTYSVTLTGESYEEPGDITVKISDAQPMRLIYEVGLRSDINSLNIVEKLGDNNRNADGSYTFYTSAWQTKLEGEGFYPSEALNTIAFFEPSKENERYYYNEDTPVYELVNGNYVKYEGNSHPEGENFYREFRVFVITDSETGRAELQKFHEAVSATSLSLATKGEDGLWYIPMGTIHRMYDDYHIKKTENTTQTIEYSFYPTVEAHMDSDLTDGDGSYYFADALLGNNGRITLEPATAILISKTVDETVSHGNAQFFFTVEGDIPDGAYSAVHFDASGNRTTRIVSVSSGKSENIMLRANERIYLTDLAQGEYTVSEVLDDEYAVKTINGRDAKGQSSVEIDLTEYTIAEAAFENTLRTFGNLIINKHVEHPLGSDHVVPADLRFEFEIVITDKNGAPLANKSFATSASDTDALTDANGKLTLNGKNLTLGASGSVTVYGIEEGSTVDVREINNPRGFTAKDAEQSAVISKDNNAVVGFVNTYAPEAVYPVNVTVNGIKTLTGREWLEGDSFEFELQRYNRALALWERMTSVTVDADNREFDLTSAIEGEQYNAAGTYHYRIVEKYDPSTAMGGVTYDTGIGYFNIVVTDKDMNGRYEISSVTAAQLASAAYNGSTSTWQVSSGFVNTYAPAGNSQASVHISKTVDDRVGAGVALEGFEFGIYDGHELIGTFFTDSNGKADFTMVYTALDAGTTYTYTVREIPGTVAGMHYTELEYKIEICIVDDLQGGIKAYVYLANANDEIPAGASDEVELGFVNIYDPADAHVTVSGVKRLEGNKTLEAGDYSFELFVADQSFAYDPDSASIVAHNDKNGEFSFGNLMFDRVGSYYYTVIETKGSAGGVTYDGTVYRITVTVSDGEGGTLKAETLINDGEKNVSSIEFVNSYKAESVEITLKGHKTLTGRNLKEGEFTFVLKDNSGTQVDNADNAKDGSFTFDPLTFTQAGEYVYTVTEDDSKKLGGVTYDSTVITVTVTVTDNGQGQLEAQVAYSTGGGISFTNTYAPSPEDAVITGNKVLTGRELKEGEFTFVLYNAEGKEIDRASNAKDGSFAFGKIIYTEAGTYTYSVKEDSTQPLERVTYDGRAYSVTVTVIDNGEGKLVIDGVTVTVQNGSMSEENKVVFENVYTPKPADVSAIITVGKEVEAPEGVQRGPEGFKFLVENLTAGTNETIVMDASGSKLFTLTLTEEDIGKTYELRISEINENEDFVTYSDKVYTVKITVSLASDNTLAAAYEVNGERAESAVCTFVNIFEPKIPQTGDDSAPIVIAAIIGVSSASLIALAAHTGKKRKYFEEA